MSLTNTGKPFETRLKHVFDAYRSIHVMNVHKCEPPCRVVGGGRNRQVIFLDNPYLDWNGVWTERGGRGLHFESKSTSENRLSIGKTGGVTGLQMQALADWTNAGAISGVIWECPSGVFYATAGTCAEIAGQRRRLEPENCHELKQGMGFIIYDLAAALRVIYYK
jgi:penicillin-binding protein-related factor A (putative recombinase)